MTAQRIFVTGGGGFVGTHLLRALGGASGTTIIALDRSGRLQASVPNGIRVVRGDLTDPASYQAELAGCGLVLHLAAATGKATEAAHRADTVAATEKLLAAAKNAGVDAILFVSSIAVSFAETGGYPYAAAKARAESAVASSGLRYTILRPTMILGDESPILKSLTALAMLPAIIVPGSGHVRVQPISVRDVVRAIARIVEQDRFHSETLEIGGPSTVSMETVLRQIRTLRTSRNARMVHVPLGPIQITLRALERLGLGAFLPATSGQFTSFTQDGVARPNSLQSELTPSLVSLDQMLVKDATGA